MLRQLSVAALCVAASLSTAVPSHSKESAAFTETEPALTPASVL